MEDIIELLKEKLQRARDCEYATMSYLDDSFQVPEEVQERLDYEDEFDVLPSSLRVHSWKENFLMAKGLPLNTDIMGYKAEAAAYMRATSPYCFGIDTSDMTFLDEAERLYAEIALFALSIGATDEQISQIPSFLKAQKCNIPSRQASDPSNISSSTKEVVGLDSVSGTSVERYQADNLFETLVKINDKNIPGFISHLIKNDAIRNPQRVFDGVCLESDGKNMFVSEGNHRIFTYKVLQAIWNGIREDSIRGASINATVAHHVVRSFDNEI